MDIRSMIVGYSDAALSQRKATIAEHLDIDDGDVNMVIADRYGLELCANCGHWFDKRDCCTYDGHGGFLCLSCVEA